MLSFAEPASAYPVLGFRPEREDASLFETPDQQPKREIETA
jgi:hypothetical protein